VRPAPLPRGRAVRAAVMPLMTVTHDGQTERPPFSSVYQIEFCGFTCRT